jgi:alanyl-tRNA synthetase
LRRAARHGRLIGVEKPFLFDLCDKVIESCKSAYPELADKQSYIKKAIKTEEESFVKTVEKGLDLLNSHIEKARETEIIDGEVVFKLHDTFGFPADLTREILAENKLSFDEEKFKELMKIQKETARANQAFKGGWDDSVSAEIAKYTTEFVDCIEGEVQTTILDIIKTDEHTMIILEKTPFYAESGGQVGDTGLIARVGNYDAFEKSDKSLCSTDGKVHVFDTKKAPHSNVSVCYCNSDGGLKKGDSVKAKIHSGRRYAIMRNHTTAHLLQAALREFLGEHVHQAGSLVDEERCRFDFTHPKALTAGEIGLIEELVNGMIFRNFRIDIDEMSIDEAKKIGAMALFGEKYGDVVRVVKIGDAHAENGLGCEELGFGSTDLRFPSIELCGGCHMHNTSEIGLFKIISESSVAAGVRRIEAVTGLGFIDMLYSKQYEIDELNEKIKNINAANQKEIARLNSIIANMQAKSAVVEEVGEIDGVKLFTQKISGADVNALRQAGDRFKEQDCVAVLVGENNILCICSKSAVAKKFHAGNIVREIAALTGGKGGGKPDSAMAGIGDVSKVDEALAKFVDVVRSFLC